MFACGSKFFHTELDCTEYLNFFRLSIDVFIDLFDVIDLFDFSLSLSFAHQDIFHGASRCWLSTLPVIEDGFTAKNNKREYKN